MQQVSSELTGYVLTFIQRKTTKLLKIPA